MAFPATLTGSPTFATASSFSASRNAAAFGNALDLLAGTGSNSTRFATVLGGGTGPFDFAAGATWTLEAFIRTTSAGAGPFVFAGRSGAGTATWWLALISGHISYDLGAGATVNGSAVVNDGNWHYIALVVNNTSAQLYVDGVTDGTAATVASPNYAVAGTAYIGGWTSSGNYFPGQISEMAVSSIAIASGTISTTWAAGAPSPFSNTRASQTAAWHFDEANGATTAADSNGQGYAVGQPAVTAYTATTIALSSTGGINGTAAYSYQWYRSLTSGFTPGGGTILGGATSITLTDTPPDGNLYFYKIVCTDSSGSPQVVTSVQTAAMLPALFPVLGFIGDSITIQTQTTSGGSTTPAQDMANRLAELQGWRSVTVSNQAIGGTKTTDWLPVGCVSAILSAGGSGFGANATGTLTFTGGSPTRAAAGTWAANGAGVVTSIAITDCGLGYATAPGITFGGSGSGASAAPTRSAGTNYTTAKNAFVAASVTHVCLMLGTNDAADGVALDATSYGAFMAGIIAGLKTDLPSAKIVVNYVPYWLPGSFGTRSEAGDAILATYLPKIDALVDSTTVYQGDVRAYTYFATHTSELTDGLHPGPAGVETFGSLWADAFIRNVLRIGGSSGVRRVALTGGISG